MVSTIDYFTAVVAIIAVACFINIYSLADSFVVDTVAYFNEAIAISSFIAVADVYGLEKLLTYIVSVRYWPL